MKIKFLLILIIFILSIFSCDYKDKGKIKSSIESPDKKNKMECRFISLGVFGGGYYLIEINNVAYYKYSIETNIFGRWINEKEIKLLSNDLPEKIVKDSGIFEFELLKILTYEDIRSDSLLIRLN